MSGNEPVIPKFNGWMVYVHPGFRVQLEDLSNEVKELKRKDPVGFAKKNANKKLLAIRKLMFDVIPQDPSRREFRLGKTLGDHYANWFRAKFFQQYRLFFRFHSKAKIIVFAWVTEEESKRAYGSKTDAYRVFRRMLESGKVPTDWNDLLGESHPGRIADEAK